MKLSIRGILPWEQWTQLPPAACEMGWQTLRQMGEAALSRQSNHIHLACFPFPLFMCSAATYQQAGAKEPGIGTSHTAFLQTHTNALVHKLISGSPLKLLQSFFFSASNCHQVSLFLHIQNASMITWARPLHLLEEEKEGRKRFCGWGNISTSILIVLSVIQGLGRNRSDELCKILKFQFSGLITVIGSDWDCSMIQPGKSRSALSTSMGMCFMREGSCEDQKVTQTRRFDEVWYKPLKPNWWRWL